MKTLRQVLEGKFSDEALGRGFEVNTHKGRHRAVHWKLTDDPDSMKSTRHILSKWSKNKRPALRSVVHGVRRDRNED